MEAHQRSHSPLVVGSNDAHHIQPFLPEDSVLLRDRFVRMPVVVVLRVDSTSFDSRFNSSSTRRALLMSSESFTRSSTTVSRLTKVSRGSLIRVSPSFRKRFGLLTRIVLPKSMA